MKNHHTAKSTAQIAVCLIMLLLGFGPGAMAATNVSGTIAVDTTWNLAGSPYIVTGSITVQGVDGADEVTTLTIEPGVQVRFNANTYLFIGDSNGNPGALVAQGTAAAPIRFTANSTTPSAGFWHGIQLRNTVHDATTRMEHCTVEYAGKNNYGTNALQIESASPTIFSCLFTNSGNYDLYFSGTVGGSIANCTFNHGVNFGGTGQVAFSGNTVNWNNSYPVQLPADNVSTFVAGTTFSGLETSSALQVTGSYLTMDSTWKSTIPYVLGTMYLRGLDGSDGVTTLILEPGVEIRMNSSSYFFVGGNSGNPGALVAHGTAAAPIRFTANSTTPSAGYWRGIQLQNTSYDTTTRMEYCNIEYAGIASGGVHALQIENSAPTIVSCQFTNSGNYDLYFSGTVGGSITNCTFNHGVNFGGTGQVAFSGNTVNWNNGYPVQLPADNVGAFVASTSFNNLDATSALQVTNGTLTLDSSWKSTIPYAVSTMYVRGVDGDDGVTTLILEPGVEVRMNSSSYFYVGGNSGNPGALSALGTAMEPILFTANSTTPAAGFWYNIRFENTMRDDFTKLEHCIVEYGGKNSQSTIRLSDASPSIRLSTIRNSGQYGIYVSGTGSNGATIECNNIKDNLVGIYTYSSAQPLIGGNNFINNTNYGVYNTGSVQVSAINNWWGDAGGPNLSGDKTYGNVNFTPWRAAPSDCVTGVPVNDPPLVPHNPSPANGAMEVNFPNGATILSWSGGDPNPSDTVVYDVLWGTDSTNLATLAEALTAATVSATGILPNTTYFWQVITRDNTGAQSTSPIWQFTTANPQPDLVVANLAWTPTSIEAGQVVTFTATIQNTGSGPTTKNFYVAFQINTARSTHTVSQQLQVGQSVQVTRTWTAQVGTASVTVESDSTRVIAEDNESNNNRTADMGTIVDTTPPEMTQITPSNGATVQVVNRVDIYLTDRFGGSVDNAATLATMTVTSGGMPVAGAVNVSSNRFYFTPNVMPLPEGSYQVSITAYDLAGNHQPYGFTFTVDNQKPAPPTITGGSVTSGTIQARPTQNRSNKSNVTLTGTREDNTGIVISGSAHLGVGSGPWSVNRGLSQGANALEIRSRDAAGNLSDPVFVDIEVDSVAPAITTITPAANAFLNSPPAEVTIAYTETGSGIDAATVTHAIKDGNLNAVPGAWTDSSGLLRFVPAGPLADSIYTVEARLVDNLGNISSPLAAVFTVDTTAPPQPVIAPVTSPTHNVTQTISGQKEAFAAILLNGQQIVDHTQGTTWQHVVTLSSGENTFSFVARDRAGNQSPAVPVTIVFDDIPPPPVTTLTASGDGIGTSVFLNWNGYNEAAHGDIQNYRIYCETAAFADVTALAVRATVNAGSYTHVVQDLTSGTTYWFAVVAVDRMGNFNPTVTAVPATPTDKLAPADVSHLTVQSFAERLVFAWQPPSANQSDLAGFKVYFNGAAAELLPPGATSLERAGLAAATAYPFKITSYDTQSNESMGVAITGYTWLNNPQGLTAQPYDGYVQLSWVPVTPATHLKHYAVYGSSTGAFTSIQGRAPALVTTTTQAKVAGLTNHQAYYFAVTAVNRSDGQRPEVTTVSATPTPDETGPEISAVQIDGQALGGSHTISRNAVLRLTATDPSGVSRIEFKLDGALLFIDYSAPYRWDIDIQKIADGTHGLEISAYDTLNNTSSASYSLIVDMAPPPAPTITQPADGLLTNQSAIAVQGQAEKESTVQLYLEGAAVGAPLAVDAQGRFAATLMLNQGVNRIRATAENRAGTGPMCPEITVTVDTTKPSPPANVAAQAIEAGVVRLTWSQPSGKLVSAYNIYRSDASFAASAAAVKVNTEPIKATGYRDLPTADGTWYYRMTSVDDAQNQSDLSAQVSATSDSVLPRISALQYALHGNVDPVSGAVAPGLVDVSVTLSEALMAMPFLSITPQAGMPINIALTRTGDTSYTGRFTITDDTPSGMAYAVFSGRDRVGNRGTDIDEGLSLLIDTDGPAIRRIVINPASPIQNDAQSPVTLTVTIGLNEAAADGTAPVLDFLLSGPGRGAINIPVLAQVAPETGDAQTWQAAFQLPADAGQLQVETLQFAHSAEDNLGNISDRILAHNHFQVYQGDLPPLEAPSCLTAKALSGGRVDLGWQAVAGASGYQLYRQAPDESQLTVLTRLEGQTIVFQDATPMDGIYLYAVSSLRNENGQEAESSPSATVSVEADAQAPAAPQNLTLQLIPQGIEAQWQAVTGEEVVYRLYRSDAMQITSVQGLEPVQATFNGAKALDRKPSPTAHNYVVTAVDPAGNESTPSNSAYLNFDLLPADTITVEQVDDQKPVLSWTHPGGSLAGFDVHMGPVGQTVRVSTDLVSATQMTDTGFAGEAREYSVIAVDANDVLSQARVIRLPAIRAERTDAKLLRRGIMNKLEYTITNLSGQPVSDLRLILNLHGSDHPSEPFSLAGNQSSVIPVIVAGYGDLADVAPLAVTVQMTPNPGETARIVRHGEIEVGEGMLALQLYNEELIRGGSGKVWFTLQNTGEAEIEIVTALNHGNKASNEALFTLLDADGNVLSTLPMQQGLGASVVNLSNGKSVARIAAGAIFESAPVQIPVPGGVPDDLTLSMSLSNIYHHCGREDQLVMRGFASTKAVQIIETEYTGAITGITPAVTSGLQDVTISGRAVLRDTQQSVSNAPLNLIISLNGFERKISLTTDNAGNFTHTFTPLASETGTYKVAALHPDLLERPVQATFTVTKVAIQPANIRLNMPKNYQQTIPVQVTAGVDTQVTNLRLAFDEWDQPANSFAQGVTYDLGATIPLLSAGEKATINVTISSDNSAPDSGGFVFRLVSDESGVHPWGHVHIDAQLTEAQPFLTYTPHFVETGVLLGETVTETITLENKGLADLEGVTLSLIGENYQPVPNWVVLNATTEATTLKMGEKRPVSVTFAPTSATAEGFYTYYLRVTAADYPVTDIGLYVSATPSGIGNALFKIKNIFTGTLNQRNEVIQGLAGARITVQNEKNLTIVHEQTSDAYGEALFNNLSAGIYKYRVRAPGHQEKIGRLWIKPGITASEEMFLEYNFVTVEWSVVETTIADKYEIVLNITYETDVPAPVVVCEPSSVSLPDLKAGDVLNGEFTLTNKGLVRADNLKVVIPADDAYIRYELLTPIPTSLGAKERITVPYRMTCIQSLSQAEEIQSGGGSGCYRSCFTTSYEGVSSNGCPYKGSVPHCFGRPCSGGSSSNSGGGSGWFTTSCGGTGCGGGHYYAPEGPGGGYLPTGGASNVCRPPTTCDKCCGGGSAGGSEEPKCGTCEELKRDDCGTGRCEPIKSSVQTLTGEFVDGETDLSVKVQGGTLKVLRNYFNNQWYWNFDARLKLSFAAVAPGSPANNDPETIDYNGSVYTKQGDKYILGNFQITIPTRDSQGKPTGYRYQEKNGRWELFENIVDDKTIAMTAFGDRNGTIGKILYDPQGRPTSLADGWDTQMIWLTYDAEGNITEARDSQNRRVEYTHTNGRLTTIKDLLGHQESFDYDAKGRVTKHIDKRGVEEIIAYNGDGLVASVSDSEGDFRKFDYSYDTGTRQFYTIVQNAAGLVKEMWYDANGYLVRVDINGETDKTVQKDGRDTSVVHPDGSTTAKEYDLYDNVTKITHPDGGTELFRYDLSLHQKTRHTDENGVTTQYEYDANGNLIRQVEAVGTDLQRTTTYEYDMRGNLITIRRAGDSQTAETVTTMTYDDYGNMLTQTDPEGKTTHLTYDIMGNFLTRIDSRGKLWQYTYDDAGHLTSTTDPNQVTTTYQYDTDGQRSRQEGPDGKLTTFAYDNRGNLIQQTTVIDPQDPSKNSVRQYEYNRDNELVRQIDPEGGQTHFTYDSEGRLIKTTDANGNEIDQYYEDTAEGGCTSCSGGGGSKDQVTRIDFPTFTREIKYDARGRKYAERDLLDNKTEHITRYTYDAKGNLTAKTDPEGKVTTYEYDFLNRLTRVIDADGGWTSYAYDKRDNLIALTDAENQTTCFAYDRNNRLVKETRPMGQETHYTYDDAGNLTEKIDAKGQRSEYQYDDAGRLTQIRYYAPGQSTAAKTVTFTYDNAGNLTGYNDDITSATYAYEDAEHKTIDTVNYPGFSKTNRYTYYKNGLKASFTGPDNIPIDYLYDSNNQLTGVQIPSVGMFTVNKYAWNRPAEETLPGGTKRLYNYDPLMRIQEIVSKDPGDNPQLNYGYTYDKVNNITAKQTEHGDYGYQYDDLYRLTDANNPNQPEAFGYDRVGNRIGSADVTGHWFPNANNELETYGNTTFQYDSNGNMIEKNVSGTITRFFYNLEDRLERVEDGDGNVIATYYYDPFGRRLWKEVSGTRTYFHYSDEGLIGEYDVTGAENKSYGWKPGKTWSTGPLFMKAGTEYYWYHNDHLGTPQVMTTSSGAVVWSAKYTSFGMASVDGGALVVNLLRFAGQYFDGETGLHYNWNRYYDPSIGRYLRADPIGFKSKEYNLYSYSKNNPIRWTDPTGEKTESECEDPCLKAPGLPDDSPDCDKYGDRRYLGTSLRCFCKCAGNSAWSKKVRGCLRCMDDKGAPTGEAHLKCYKAASDGGHDRPEIALGYCYTKCLFTTK